MGEEVVRALVGSRRRVRGEWRRTRTLPLPKPSSCVHKAYRTVAEVLMLGTCRDSVKRVSLLCSQSLAQI